MSSTVQIAELKSKLEIKSPKQQVFDPTEATRSEVLRYSPSSQNTGYNETS